MAVTGEWGILKKIPVSADYNQLIYDQAELGMDYLDCSNLQLSLIDFKLKYHNENIVNLHGNRVSFSICVFPYFCKSGMFYIDILPSSSQNLLIV